MNIVLLLPILIISAPVIICGISLIEDSIKAIKEKYRQKEKEAQEAELKENRQWLYKKAWNRTWTYNKEPIDIRNVPQLSFEQWLTFYNSTPSNWLFDEEQSMYLSGNNYYIFPKYKKGKLSIITFWKTPEDLDKFIKWQKNEYKNGDAAIFEEARNKQLTKLTKALREDMKQRHEQAQKEIEELERQIVVNMPKPKEEDPIQKCLREQREEKKEKLDNNIDDLRAYVHNQYPDYYINDNCERIMTNDGATIIKVALLHKYKPGYQVQKTYGYDKKTNTWQELSTSTKILEL